MYLVNVCVDCKNNDKKQRNAHAHAHAQARTLLHTMVAEGSGEEGREESLNLLYGTI